jgi:hypothetical protein
MIRLSLLLVWAVSLPLVSLRAADAGGVKITEAPGKLRIEINGQLFTEYVYEGAPHVYYYPVLGPGGTPMTRNFPMKNVEGEDTDHKHHRSLWYSHGAVNGVDFWAEGGKAGKIVHEKFLEKTSGPDVGVIRSANRWVGPDGNVVMTDERTFRVFNRPDTERLFDFEITLKAGEKEIVLGDTKEGSMGIRVNEQMRVTPYKTNTGSGHIVLSSGVRDDIRPAKANDTKTWGKRAAWCDFWGKAEGKTVGIAIFDHPQNPKHPTWWHVRDTGLFAANPYGVSYFEKKPPGTGNIVIPPKQTLTFRYRFFLHEGDEKQARVAERYQEFAAGK